MWLLGPEDGTDVMVFWKLEIAALSRDKRELERRRESCTDAGARNDLDEEIQRIVTRRLDREKQVRQV